LSTLLVLTAVTVIVAYGNLGVMAAPIAVGIAAVKATLVVLYFMHVRYESPLIALCAAAGFIFIVILVGITMGEVSARPRPAPDVLAPPPLAPD
jgi:cytochrome c oxidase subunit 4